MANHAPKIARKSVGGRLIRCSATAICFFAAVSGFVGVQALVGTPVANADVPVLSGTGSSYAAVAIDQWVSEASSLGYNINYSTASSVIGLTEFAQYPTSSSPPVDFGASEIGYSAGQANDPPASFNYQYLPDIAGATCLDYNLSDLLGNNVTNLRLDSAVLAGIFSGAITNWDDPAIQQLNSSIALPNTPITVVWRTDASGDNYIFSDYLYTTQQAAWNSFSQATNTSPGPQAIWPSANVISRTAGNQGQYNFGNWQAQNGSDNASNVVSRTPGAITYVETAYAVLHHNPCAGIENPAGLYLAPSAAADAVALQNDVLQPDLEQNLVPVFNSPQQNAYPISAYSYLLMPEQSSIPASKQQEEAGFINFFACRGQEAAQLLGYSPLPPNLVAADFEAAQRIDGVALPPPTATNCPDPYVTGAFNAAPPPVISGGGTGTSTAGGGPATSPIAANGSSGGSGPGGAGSSSLGASGGTPGSIGSQGSSTGSTSASGSSGSAGATTALAGGTSAANELGGPGSPGEGPGGSSASTSGSAATQIRGVAMQEVVGGLLGLRLPANAMSLAAGMLIALVVVPPIYGGWRRRKRALAGVSPVVAGEKVENA